MAEKTGMFILGLIILVFLGWGYANSELHFPFNPYIDTIFAEGFSENNFNKVNIGMKKEEVIEILGEPLSKDYWGNNPKCWQYSTDGKLYPHADFSYYLFQVCFSDIGMVESKPVYEFYN